MNFFYIFLVILSNINNSSDGRTLWQSVGLSNFADRWKTLDPFPSNRNELFPELKLYVFTKKMLVDTRYSKRVANVPKIDPLRLDNYTSELNKYSTVFYVFGFLDKPPSAIYEKFVNKTPVSLLFYAYTQRTWAAERVNVDLKKKST